MGWHSHHTSAHYTVPLTITSLWLLLFFSIQGPLLWFLFLRQLALFSQKGNRGVTEGETQALKVSARDEDPGRGTESYLFLRDLQGSHHPLSHLTAG